MIRIPDVLLGQRARAFESCDCSEIDVYGWAFLCPDTKVIVHGDGVTKYKIVPVTFPMPSAPKAGCISYNALYYIRCEDGKVYEYNPATRAILRSFQVAQPDSTATSWISVSRSRYSSLTVQSVMYVLTQGASGELVAIRLPDGQMFRGRLGIGDLIGGVIDSTPGGNAENYPDSIPSQVIDPLTNPMGPLSCQVVTRQGVTASIQLTPLFGFVTKSVMQNTALSNVVWVMKPFASRMPPPPPVVPPDIAGYNSSFVMSVRLVVPTYGGPCLRVRRSSDNAEKDIWFYRGWLDETELLAFVGSGDGFVTAWYNQTPQYGIVRFIQPDASKQPPLVSSGVIYKRGITGRPYLRFDGTRYLRNETPGDIKNILHYNRMHGMFAGSNYTGTQGGYLGAAFSIGRYSWGAILSMTSEAYPTTGQKHRIVDFMAQSRIRIDGRYENPATLYQPDPNNLPEFISLAMTVRENHIRMRWKSERMGDYYADYPPLSQSLDPVYDDYNFYSTIGCNSIIDSFARYGIQEVIIQSIDWDVATVDQMLSNQEWEFR